MTAAFTSDPRLATAARSLREDGHAVLTGLMPRERVEAMRQALDAAFDAAAPELLHSKLPRWLAPDLEVSGTGLVFHQLLGRVPALADGLVHPLAHALMQEVLGEGVYLEFVGAVVCDRSRPFFEWHHHVGGIDDELARRQGRLPAGQRPERVAMLIYLDETGPGLGQLLVDPARRKGPPPHPTDQTSWPGQVAVAGPPGTVVCLDQVTWHAVTAREVEGLRRFVGLWFAAADAPAAEAVDRSLAVLQADDPALAAVLAARPERRAGASA